MGSINHLGVECTKDKCEGVICKNGFCDAGNCSCKEGYISNGNSCEETCDVNPCGVLILVCTEK